MKPFVTTICAVALLVCLVGCAHHPRRVDCEAHLKAINAPAPATSTSAHP